MQVDPSVLASTRAPLQNPRAGDYLLKQTASTEGIASKRSLELKKRYLLGENALSAGIMKSDSTSMLDSKFRSFHSTISGCQKLLNPAPDISPAMQTFLKNTMVSDGVQKSGATTDAPNQRDNQTTKETEEQIKRIEEKENVYEQIVNTKNELNKSDNGPNEMPSQKSGKSINYSETINTVLVENKNKDPAPKVIDTINLITPEKQPTSTIFNKSPDHKIIIKQDFANVISKLNEPNDEIIDLTNDTPVKDRSLECKTEDYKLSSISKESELREVGRKESQMSPEKTKTAIDSLLKNSKPLQEESANQPILKWVTKNKANDVESDSLSSSSSSTPADIPHYILDSTTSPDTQPGDHVVSSTTVHIDPHKDLMQIDSLMIIDGKYIGDPEDLKHMRIPDNLKEGHTDTVPPQLPPKGESPKKESQKTQIIVKPKAGERQFKYESIYKKPDLKFDTRNENKIDTLKNIPLILPKEMEKPTKPATLSFGDAKKNSDVSDNDKTPTVTNPGGISTHTSAAQHSDSETEMTGPVLTETELSDWTADDAVSENFVDIEFVLNSNKGTIKRNKKNRKKNGHLDPNRCMQMTVENKVAPIAKDLDFEGIEFMDTGSEESYMETYSATNRAMLKNRGYVQFVDTNPDKSKNNFGNANGPAVYRTNGDSNSKPNSIDLGENARSKEVRGVDYIEQGACILGNEADLKTPINEVPSMFATRPQAEHPDSQNEIEEDSLVMVGSHGGNTTTEESEALTVVTSPLESAPRNMESLSSSSIDKIEKTLSSNSPLQNSSKKNSLGKSDPISVLKTDTSRKQKSTEESNSGRKNSDDITYEDYVRQLQMKITQISNARDSIDIRKTKRKHSRGDLSAELLPQQHHSVIDSNNKSLSIYVSKADEPATVTEKLEEITKERTKQKDLIHDLVMDKLQSKKQLNAEKRLNRSRNRSSAFSISPSTANIAPGQLNQPHLAHSQTTCSIGSSNVYAMQPSDRYHSMQLIEQERRHSMHKSPTISSPSNEKYFAQLANNRSTQRPHSDHVENFTPFETPKLNKTQSFCVYANRTPSNQISQPNNRQMYPTPFSDHVNAFSTPILPPRRKIDDELAQTTEKLRQDARLRARLKSNQDLGLSPEEKIALLRKRYNLDQSNTSQHSMVGATLATLCDSIAVPNKSDDMKVRERKMMASKSVNDIAITNMTSECANGSKSHQKLSDFTSDPNLLEEKTITPKRRHKDPERRKSIIQAVSDFFHKKKDKEPSSPKEKSDSVFGRFRISPKSKSKVPFFMCFNCSAFHH